MPAPDLTARRLALDCLERIRAGEELDAAWMNATNRRTLDERDRAFARQLVLTTLRHFGEMEAVLKGYVKKRPTERAQLILLLGMAQILWLEVPPHAAVDTAVTLAKKAGLVPISGLVNAVLKRIAGARAEVMAAARPEENLPGWLRKALTKAYGEAEMRAIAQAYTTLPPLDLTLRDPASASHWIDALEATPLPTGSLRRALATDVRALPGFAEGAWWVQDAAAALPVRLFSDLQGHTALDLCAAPGGKTLQMAALGAEVTAVDRSGARLTRLQENLARTGLHARIVEADARHYTPTAPVTRILLDAPCTATGTLRRHPDVALHRQPGDLAELATLQRALLDHALTLLVPGGELVYCVCSLLPEEGEQVLRDALARHPALRVRPADAARLGVPPAWVTPEGALRTLPSYWPEQGGLDGFFAVCLQKT
jgi:16S rRNA (cytosine967-C5)-methyltransferase